MDALSESLAINTSLTFLDLFLNQKANTETLRKFVDILYLNRSLRKLKITSFEPKQLSLLKQLCLLNHEYFLQNEKSKLWPDNHSQLEPFERTQIPKKIKDYIL
eukprot:TRINITY_DN13507_c0_g2_i1.p1 TRINITY_DN13507_c0_g2~~TRINITY_DN13507_c0_g2_i1.p1  ORF type:complete len:104 (-),score=20.06 TRINITY_DN13507_c0_g2_i1:144-455(-)